MKLRIKIPFHDKETNKIHARGDIVNFKKERAEELLKNYSFLVEKATKNDK